MKKIIGIALLALAAVSLEAAHQKKQPTKTVKKVARAPKKRIKVVKAKKVAPKKKVKVAKALKVKKAAPKKVKVAKVKKVKKNFLKPKTVKVAKVKAHKQAVEMVGFYNTLEYGVMKYARDKEVSVVDADSNAQNTSGLISNASADSISFTKTRPVLLVGLGFGVEFDGLGSLEQGETTQARLGVATSFAQKNDAIEGEYLDTGQTVSTLVTRQDVKRFEGLVVGEYNVFNDYDGLTYKVDAGAGVSVGALRDLRLYQKDNNSYIGQRLKAKKISPVARLGASVEKKMNSFCIGAGFRVGFSKQKYNKNVIVEKPDTTADQVHQDIFALLEPTSDRGALPCVPPEFNVRSYEFRISIGKDF